MRTFRRTLATTTATYNNGAQVITKDFPSQDEKTVKMALTSAGMTDITTTTDSKTYEISAEDFLRYAKPVN